MESNPMFPTDYHQLAATNYIFEADQQQFYFPPQWVNSPSDLGPDDPQGHLSPMQGQLAKAPASEVRSSRSSSDASSYSSNSSRRHSREDKSTQRQDRRRAQNRAAQRAYRERKEQIRHELEDQVKKWQDKHQALRETYVDQAQEVQRLRETIDKLQSQLRAIQDSRLSTNTALIDFDTWPDLEWKAA